MKGRWGCVGAVGGGGREGQDSHTPGQAATQDTCGVCSVRTHTLLVFGQHEYACLGASTLISGEREPGKRELVSSWCHASYINKSTNAMMLMKIFLAEKNSTRM